LRADHNSLSLLHLLQPPDGAPHGGSGGGGVVPGAPGHHDAAVLVVTEPDADSLSLHLVLSAEGAVVFTVLGDFHLLDSLPQAGTITGTILSGDPDLLGSLSHHALHVLLLL